MARPKPAPIRTCTESQLIIDDCEAQSTDDTWVKAMTPPKLSAIHPADFQNPKPEIIAVRTERSVGW